MASVFVVVGVAVAPNAAGRVGTAGADEDEEAAAVDVGVAAGAGAGVEAGKAEDVAASAPLRSHGLGGETIVNGGRGGEERYEVLVCAPHGRARQVAGQLSVIPAPASSFRPSSRWQCAYIFCRSSMYKRCCYYLLRE